MTTPILFSIILATIVYIALPYFRKAAIVRVGVTAKNGRLADLLARRDNLLVTIKDLEFDHAMGKISAEDFAEMNSRYRQEAVIALKQIDAANGKNGGAHKREADPRPAKSQPKSFCSACGAGIGGQNRFCSNCGQRLQ